MGGDIAPMTKNAANVLWVFFGAIRIVISMPTSFSALSSTSRRISPTRSAFTALTKKKPRPIILRHSKSQTEMLIAAPRRVVQTILPLPQFTVMTCFSRVGVGHGVPMRLCRTGLPCPRLPSQVYWTTTPGDPPMYLWPGPGERDKPVLPSATFHQIAPGIPGSTIGGKNTVFAIGPATPRGPPCKK